MEERIIELKGMDYTVREDGKIFGNHTCGRGKAGKELKQRLNSDGYWCVTVGVKSKRTVMRVHRIVALAFIDNPLNLPEVDHIDNDKTNNHVSNLQWISSKDNKRKIPFERRSVCRQGEKNGRATFTDNEVLEIRALYETGMMVSEIARKYDRPHSTILNIVHRNTWKHI